MEAEIKALVFLYSHSSPTVTARRMKGGGVFLKKALFIFLLNDPKLLLNGGRMVAVDQGCPIVPRRAESMQVFFPTNHYTADFTNEHPFNKIGGH